MGDPKIRVCEIAYNWPVEQFIGRHITSLSAHNFPVNLVVRHAQQHYSAGASIGQEKVGFPVSVMPNFDHLSLPGKLMSLPYLISGSVWERRSVSIRDRVVLGFFDRLSPHLIHFHTATLAASMRWIPERLGIPYSVSLRGSDVQVWPLQSPTAGCEIAAALTGAAGIHAVCDHLGRVASCLTEAPLAFDVIYTTVPVPDSLPPYPACDSDGLHLVSSGRFHWTKGFQNLLIALRGLLDRGIQARLTLVGNGPDEARLRYWIENQDVSQYVTLTGKLDYYSIQSILRNAHAYVQSSIAEGFSNSLAEAMAQGCPVFATAVGGTAEVIQDGANGFLLSPLEPTAWADRLSLLKDRDHMQSVRANAFVTAQRLFSSERHALDFERFYREALGDRKPNSESQILNKSVRAASTIDFTVQIIGSWQWQSGADLILQAVAQAIPPGSLRIDLVGAGPQKDELLYLCKYLGFAEVGILDSVTCDVKTEKHLNIFLSDVPNGDWKVEFPEGLCEALPFGSGQRLISILKRHSA